MKLFSEVNCIETGYPLFVGDRDSCITYMSENISGDDLSEYVRWSPQGRLDGYDTDLEELVVFFDYLVSGMEMVEGSV